MRIYVRQGNGVWSAVAPEVPGIGLTGHENWATREEAIERCRSLIADEIAAYARLGTPLELSQGDEIAVLVGSPVVDGVAHAAQQPGVGWVPAGEAGDAAHVRRPPAAGPA